MNETEMLKNIRATAKARNEGLKKDAAARLKRNAEWNKAHK
jgi:hypothetical protein